MLTIRTPLRAGFAAALALVVLAATLPAQDAQSANAAATKSSGGKKVLNLAEYGRWNRIAGVVERFLKPTAETS